ncbi:flagellar hook-length control protein FliK [Gracilibacillus kekensis]|uniref:Hook-length control protein FliK n=1 Tax=Gracilibacillus kekensis TaxID=1027249 RepID=A0A1M7PGM4_9BACI|nr:flagellar hook-length control protein FliK [Gracilibacillus kekensis]SHN16226.1 hook-length control protein FliK [Gracilibacillus kekensis]
MHVAANLLINPVTPEMKGPIRSELNGNTSFQKQLLSISNSQTAELNKNELETLLSKLPEGFDLETLKQIKDVLNNLDLDLEKLISTLENADSEEISSMFTEEQLTLLKGYNSNNSNKEHELSILGQIMEVISAHEQQVNNSFINQILLAPSNNVNGESNATKIDAMVKKVEVLLTKLEQNKLSQHDFKQLNEMLRQWSQLDSNAKGNAQALLAAMTPTKTNEIWNKLLENFQNRMAMEKNYGQSQKVTQQDIAKWISGAMENQGSSMNQEQALSQTRSELQTLMNQQVNSKVQQYVIHTQQTNTEQQVAQKQLIDQFQQAIQKSNFMKMPNGTNQLMLRLQPEHLGDVMVKLTQVNGEMVVKMMVASQGAKELLEGNLNQLRHMFSPQQVLIERQDTLTQTGQEKLTDENQDSLDDKGQSENDQNDGEQSESEEQDKINFHDLLMDAKV